MNAIEIRNLSKDYRDFRLDGLSLTLPQGCIMGLIGENGAGKSTTIKSILGIIRPDSGSIRVFGREISPKDKNDIGVVLDEVGIPECFSVRDVNRVMKHTYHNWDEAQFFGFVKRFRLPEKKRFKEFSKGMKMKLGIAAALSHHAKLLILDEATSGLDPLIRDEITDLLCEFTRNESCSILISSHIVSDLEKLCDYIAFLHDGRLTLCEEKDRLLERYGFLNTTEAELSALDAAAVKGKKSTPYGVQAIVDRELLPHGFESKPVTIEELFVFMSKEAAS